MRRALWITTPPQKKTKTKEKVQEGLFSENNQEETENTVAG